jgi:hypothetical protein
MLWIRINESGSGYRSGSGSGSRVLMTKRIEKNTAENFVYLFFLSKNAIYLSLGFHQGRPSCRRSLQPSKEKNQHFKT